MLTVCKEMNALCTRLFAGMAAHTQRWIEGENRPKSIAFRIVTPTTAHIATLQKDSGSDSRSIEFQPLFDACKPALSGKKIALFGSYGWGDGEWMRSWEDDCRAAGAVLACDSVICQETPDADALAACEKLGEALK